MKFLVKWKIDRSQYPANRDEAAKLLVSQLEMVKADLKTGALKDWGAYVSANGGYMISEAASEIDLYNHLRKWRPHIQFEVSEPAVTIDQEIDMTKKALAALPKK
jgi:hypothetical protein